MKFESNIFRHKFNFHLARDCKCEITFARDNASDLRDQQLSIVEGEGDVTIVFDKTIRLGEDWLDKPVILQKKKLSQEIRVLRDRLSNRALAAVELGVEDLHTCVSKVKLEDYERNEWPHTDVQGFQKRLSSALQRCFWLAYRAGHDEGLEEGQMVLKTILGKCPSSSRVYKYEKRSCFLPIREKASDVHLKLNVEDANERERKYSSMLFKYGKALFSVECGLKNVIDQRIEITVQQSDSKPSETTRHLGIDYHHLRTEINNCVYTVFDIGQFDGFEEGQNSVKDTYKDLGCHLDGKIYTFATTSTQYGITLDEDSDERCMCGQCFRCWTAETTTYEDNWIEKFQRAKDISGHVEAAFEEERERKRHRINH